MSERSFSYILHSFFWTFLLFLPMFFTLFVFISGGEWAQGDTIGIYNPTFMFSWLRSGVLYRTFESFICGAEFGVFQSVGTTYDFLPLFFAWFTFVQLFHLVFDFIFFLPKFLYNFVLKRLVK